MKNLLLSGNLVSLFLMNLLEMSKVQFVVMLLFLSACQPGMNQWMSLESQLKNYDSLGQVEVCVMGTYHFNDSVLSNKSQAGIDRLLSKIADYQPTKILLEWEPDRFLQTNDQYRQYLDGSLDISDRYNEVYQLGFRLAKMMGHDSIYLFDDQTEFIGSLEAFSTDTDPFSFDLFTQYGKEEDGEYYRVHEQIIIENYEHNLEVISQLSLDEHITMLNSDKMQRINAQRMHIYESRVGIQKNWAGPDWLGRWYRRNVRMMANALKLSNEGDRLLIIVGDNHKWVLDMLFDFNPEFKLQSSWEYLSAP